MNNGLDTADSDNLMMRRAAIFSSGINKRMTNSSRGRFGLDDTVLHCDTLPVKCQGKGRGSDPVPEDRLENNSVQPQLRATL